jgi:hypothetical protein
MVADVNTGWIVLVVLLVTIADVDTAWVVLVALLSMVDVVVGGSVAGGSVAGGSIVEERDAGSVEAPFPLHRKNLHPSVEVAAAWDMS